MNVFNPSHLQHAIDLSLHALDSTDGGPFGAIIVREGNEIASGVNKVIGYNDPTAHAEINAIRKACQKLQTFDLSGCQLYTSCEPCPMCLGAVYWSRLEVVYFANTRKDAANIGFDDAFIYDELKLPNPEKAIPFIHKPQKQASQIFDQWLQKSDRAKY